MTNKTTFPPKSLVKHRVTQRKKVGKHCTIGLYHRSKGVVKNECREKPNQCFSYLTKIELVLIEDTHKVQILGLGDNKTCYKEVSRLPQRSVPLKSA